MEKLEGCVTKQSLGHKAGVLGVPRIPLNFLLGLGLVGASSRKRLPEVRRTECGSWRTLNWPADQEPHICARTRLLSGGEGSARASQLDMTPSSKLRGIR